MAPSGAARTSLEHCESGLPESASWHGVVPDSFRQFRERQPDAELQLNPLSSLEQVEAVRSGRLDVGFVFDIPKTDATWIKSGLGAAQFDY